MSTYAIAADQGGNACHKQKKNVNPNALVNWMFMEFVRFWSNLLIWHFQPIMYLIYTYKPDLPTPNDILKLDLEDK